MQRLQDLWDKTEALIRAHRRKCLALGFFVVFLPRWIPNAVAAWRWLSTYANIATLSTVPEVEISFVALRTQATGWNWITAPVGLSIVGLAAWGFFSEKRQRSYREEWTQLRGRFEQLEKDAIAASHRLKDAGTMVRAERPDDDPMTPFSGWRIRSSDRDCQRDAEGLCGLAGALLKATRIRPRLVSPLRATPDDKDRWLSFLKDLGEGRPLDMRDQVTSTVEGIYRALSFDEIDNVAKSSVRGCTECQTRQLRTSW